MKAILRHFMFLCLGAGLLLQGTGCASKQVLVVYSPHGADVLQAYEALFEAAHPGVDVQALDMGASDILGRIRAESARPAADIWWGAPSTLFTQAAAEGLLAPYVPTWAEAAGSYRDPQNHWYATYLSPIAIMYNTRGYEADAIPQSWDALLDPAWSGKIALRQPLPSGTMRTFISAMITRAESEDAGIAWLQQLHAATAAYPENPGLLYDHLKKNPERISVWLQPDIVMQRDLNSFPFGYVLPPQTPVLTDGIALVNNAPHPELAKTFYEFVTTREALAHQAKDFAKMPARNDIDPATLPEWMCDLRIDAMPIDWAEFAEKQDAWCSRWEQEVYNAE